MYFRSIETGARYWAELDDAEEEPPWPRGAYVRYGRWWWPVLIAHENGDLGRRTWVFRDNIEPEAEVEVIGSFDPTKTKADEIIEEHKREVMAAEEKPITESTEPVILTDSEPDLPNIHLYLREMTYNTGQAFVALAETVSNKEAPTLYLLQAALASISDEIRRLSDKEESSHG